MNDLLQAAGYAAIVYLLFNYLVSFGSGRPLVEWINPGRRYLPLLAVALFGGAYTSLKYAVVKHKGEKTQLQLMYDLVGHEKAEPEVVGAVSFVTFGLATVMLTGWCWWYLPRAPQTFSPNPKDLIAEYGRALRHYVRWAGGLDFAVLGEVRDGQMAVVAEGADDRSILRGLNRLPGVHATPDGKPGLDVTAQRKIWTDLALDLFNRWAEFDRDLAASRQGRVVGVNFDLRYGAVFAEVIEDAPAATDGRPVGTFLFAVALNQHEVNTLTAARHFADLSRAIRYIRTGVVKG